MRRCAGSVVGSVPPSCDAPLRRVAAKRCAGSVVALVILGAAVALAGSTPAPQSRPGFDHTRFAQILRKNVKGGKVDYRGLKTRQADLLDRYVKSLAAADPRRFAGKDDELAFWINAYNAFVIAGVLERYPGIESVMDVPDFFKAKRWKAAGQLHSLDEIENEIIRARFKDPRVHFVLVRAAQSCPPLLPRALTAGTVQAELDGAARTVVNSPRYVSVEVEGKRLRLTRIMSWYQQHFVEKYGSLEAFLLRYLKEPKRARVAAGGYRIEFTDYDWALNDSRRSAAR